MLIMLKRLQILILRIEVAICPVIILNMLTGLTTLRAWFGWIWNKIFRDTFFKLLHEIFNIWFYKMLSKTKFESIKAIWDWKLLGGVQP